LRGQIRAKTSQKGRLCVPVGLTGRVRLGHMPLIVFCGRSFHPLIQSGTTMKVRNSLKSLRGRHRDNQIVRRKGRVYIINKTQKRFKARQG